MKKMNILAGRGQFVYASFWERLLAFFIDVLIVEAIGFLVSLFFGQVGVLSPGEFGFNLSGLPADILYSLVLIVDVFLIDKFGQTPGKMILKIKVVKIRTSETSSYTNAFLREVIGKFISTLVVGLGYFWVIWDKNKQAWHDKIAETVVIKV